MRLRGVDVAFCTLLVLWVKGNGLSESEEISVSRVGTVEEESVNAVFCDQRLKENIQSADNGALLEAVLRVQLKEFDYKYEQFYNKVFGKRQLGVIAQEVQQVIPRAVGIVPKRNVGQPDDDKPTVLENVHVFNPELLYMSNVGATQQIHRNQVSLGERVEHLRRSLEDTSADVKAAKKGQEELSALKLKQMELELLAKEAHLRSEATVKMEKTLESLAQETGSQRTERQTLQLRLDKLQDLLNSEITTQSTLHRESATEVTKMQGTLEFLQQALTNLRVDSLRRSDDLENQVKQGKQASDDLSKAIKDFDAAHQIATKEAALETKKLISDVDTTLKGKLQDQQKAIDELRSALHVLEKRVSELQGKVEQAAGEEIVERRRIAEAEVKLEQARQETDRLRAEQEMARMKQQATFQQQAEERAANATASRIKLEASASHERELQQIAAREAAALREEQARFESQRRLQEAAQVAEIEALKIKESLAKETASVAAEAETRRERENKDVRMEMARLQAEESRKATTEMIQAIAAQTAEMTRRAAESPAQLIGAIGLAVLLAVGVYAAREGAALWRTVMQRRLGQPSLVRETSTQATSARARLACKVRSMSSDFRRMSWDLVSPPSADEIQRRAKDLEQRRARRSSLIAFMSDVVLPKAKGEQINRIARATRVAHSNGTPLRHVLFYGPPGTGKSMVCRYLANWCELDYAIMSGADVAPLKDRAVTEIHKLFAWAKGTPKGVLLFIDEADAFLASRDGGAVSESLRNALTALLFHTGADSNKVMLVLATNRPGDIDRAVLDRVDESVQFDLPSEHERLLMLTQYFDRHVTPYVTEESAATVKATLLQSSAKRTAGFSGREISKLMITVQAHVFGHQEADGPRGPMSPRKGGPAPRVTSPLFQGVLDHAVQEHAKLSKLAHLQDYTGVFHSAHLEPRKEE